MSLRGVERRSNLGEQEEYRTMFDLDRFIEDCRDAVRQDQSHKAAREVLARANSDPAAILKALGAPTRAGVTPLYKSDTVTILNVVWGRRMTIMPHDHRMWAVIGVYTGREDNIF
jgi:predicted metal-dependent enzyme (double-stranded beta helix superfamily)